MAVEINGDEINFGNYKISVVPGGIYIDGVFKVDSGITKTQAQGTVSGYASGGYTGTFYNIIEKFPFTADANATDVGDLTTTRHASAGQSSSTNGYTGGGRNGPPATDNIIDKFPFATDSNATDVGDLTQARRETAGQSSTESGYASGGTFSLNTVDKFPFAADTNAADVGDLTVARSELAGQSSAVSGYNSGGSPRTNTIDKFPFAADANATDVGDLILGLS